MDRDDPDQFEMLMVSPQIKWLPAIVYLCKSIKLHLSLTTVLQIFYSSSEFSHRKNDGKTDNKDKDKSSDV